MSAQISKRISMTSIRIFRKKKMPVKVLSRTSRTSTRTSKTKRMPAPVLKKISRTLPSHKARKWLK